MSTNGAFTAASPEQLAAVTRYIDRKGQPFYTARSASDPDGVYTLRWKPGYHVPSCQCRASYEGVRCWHVNTVLYAEALYQESLRNGQVEADEREREAVQRYGDRAYAPQPFSLLKAS